MKGKSKTPDSQASSIAALIIALAALGACGSSTKRSPAPTVVGDRRELPAVHVAPADGGAAPPVDTNASMPAPPAFPRTLALGALGEGERIADLAVQADADRILVAWVTYFAGSGPPVRAPRAPGKKGQPSGPPSKNEKQATVMVRALDAAGETLGGANVISVKADSVGGVSLAPGASGQGDAGLAWVGKDAGIGQVFITRLSRSGEKQTQRMVTRSKEGCSDVALVRYKDGFIVTYVDSRDGNVGVYATKVGKDLERVGTERVIAQAKGEASDVRMLARGEDIVVAWAEARQNPDAYGVFTARLLPADLSLRGDPTRVVLSSQHTKGVELTAMGEGVVLGWVEDAPPASAGANAPKAVALARLDAGLRAVAEPLRVSLPGQASALALDCDRACRVVVSGAEGDDLAFYGFFYEGSAPPQAARLASITGVSTEDTNPVLARDWLFFAEDNLHGAGRIRKAKIAWR